MKTLAKLLSMGSLRSGILVMAVVFALSGLTRYASAQATTPSGVPQQPIDDTPLLEQEPFDLVILNAANRNYRAKISPMEIPGTPRVLERGKPSDEIRVLLLDDYHEYDVEWRHIVEVKLYEQMVFEEAAKYFAQAKQQQAAQQYAQAEVTFDQAYQRLVYLQNSYPKYTGLQAAMEQFLFYDSLNLYRQQKFASALSVMEELHRMNPNFQPSLTRPMSLLLEQIVRHYYETKDYRSARLMINRLLEKHGDNPPQSLVKWKQALITLAVQLRDQANAMIKVQKYREAIELARQMTQVWPETEGSQDLLASLDEVYPQISVAVVQPAVLHDEQRIDNWSARRTGRLIHRTLVEFRGPGAEGGLYEFPLGQIEKSADGRRISFRMNQFGAGQQVGLTDGYELSQRLLQLADPRQHEYVPGWGGLITDVSIDNVFKVDVDMIRGHVLPQAMLRVPMTQVAGEAAKADSGLGTFQVTERSDKHVRYFVKTYPRSQLAEVIERRYDDAQRALGALRRGEVDVIDRLFPSDAIRLQKRLASEQDTSIVIEPYALPTVHMLLIKQRDDPFLANRSFRRALVFALDRQRILNEELLGGEDIPGCRILSGPFPAGADETDPLAYAYDHELEPRVWRPRVAKLLTIVSETELNARATKLEEEPPKRRKLLLGHPAHEAARVAAQAIVAYLKVSGIECSTKEFPPGLSDDPDDECDLVYAEIAIWEPVVDAQRLFGRNGVAPSTSPFVIQALRLLDESGKWGDVHEQLMALHHAVHHEVAVVPLWQTMEYFAYSKRVQNVVPSNKLVWLYQNVDQWALDARTARR